MTIKLSITTAHSTVDVTGLFTYVNWSGEYTQCSRTVQFGLAASPVDGRVPVVDCPLGAGVLLELDGVERFNGFIFSRQKLTDSSTVDVTCYDRGIYLKRNKAVYKYTNQTPEDITRQVCTDFGIVVGTLAVTDVRVSRNFVGTSLYQIIQTVYTLASNTTGDKYQIRFDGDKLSVLVKDIGSETVVIQGGSNLMSAATTESIDKMINRVVIYDSDDNLVGAVANDELIALYGQMQEYIRQSQDEDAYAKAQKLLDDNGVSQKITINNFGNVNCITGNAVVLQEPYTGLFGLFWIDADVHTWKNSLYLNKLTLNFRRMMDEQEAGSIPKAEYSGGGVEEAADKWRYIYGSGEGTKPASESTGGSNTYYINKPG